MSDILNSDDLHLLVAEFYKKLFSDDSIAYIFTEVVKFS
jgi:hemoglobin